MYGRASIPCERRNVGDALRVGDRQAVDDAAPRHQRELLRQPGEALRLVLEDDRVELERVARQRAAEHDGALAELFGDVGDHAIVRRRGRREDRHAGVQELEDATDPPVVGAEIVAPVGDAVGLVDDEQADRALDARQDVRHEAFVGEPLRRDEQDVDGVGGEALVDRVPFVGVARVDRRGAEAEAPGHRDLVAHQRQERADDQGGSVTLVAADPRRDPVDEALAPARPLDDEGSVTVLDDRLDRLALAVAECGAGAEHGLEVLGQKIHGLFEISASQRTGSPRGQNRT